MRLSGGPGRSSLALAAVCVTLTLAGCGSADGEGSAAPSSSPTAQESGAAGDASADGRCGDGAFDTQVVEAAEGVEVTVPADWQVRSAEQRTQFAFGLPGGDEAAGYLVVQPSEQSLEEALDEVLAATREATQTEAETDLDVPGMEAARLTTSRYDAELDDAFTVDVVAVGDGLRVVANLSAEEDADLQAVVESCLSSLSRTAG